MGSSHKKQGKIADNNAKKAKVFSKLVRLIQVEAKKSNGDVHAAGLSAAIKKASEVGDTTPLLYEAYGPGGVGMIITALTDNTNRTGQDVKSTLSKNGGSLGAQGSVSWNFTQNPERDWIANTYVEISEEVKHDLENLVELLEEHDDVQDVYHNAR